MNGLNGGFLARKKANRPHESKGRIQKSAPYRDPEYPSRLEQEGSFMEDNDWGLLQSSKDLIRDLLTSHINVPVGTLFDDDMFDRTCEMLALCGDSRVLRDISSLIVPSPEVLAVRGEKDLEYLTETCDEVWNESIPLITPPPQPDLDVGFRREAFTLDGWKLDPFTGNGDESIQSWFLATFYVYFPFLAFEVKCGGESYLDVADRQNAHSMTLAVRGGGYALPPRQTRKRVGSRVTGLFSIAR